MIKSNLVQLFRTAIAAVDPYTCVKHHLVFNNQNSVNDDEEDELHLGNNRIILNHNLYVAAFGKAALGIARLAVCHQEKVFFCLSQRHVSSSG